MVGRSDAATVLNDTTYFVGLPIQGSYALRIIDSGEPGGPGRLGRQGRQQREGPEQARALESV